jgi:hypothetical protein
MRDGALDADAEIELSKEALAAFDEGIHSIETEPSFTAEEVRGMLAIKQYSIPAGIFSKK